MDKPVRSTGRTGRYDRKMRSSMVRSLPILPLLQALLLLGYVMGCQAERPKRVPPATYPVTGTVSRAGGGSLAGNVIQFIPDNLELGAESVIQDDGSFVLHVVFHNDKIPGASAGPHKVKVLVRSAAITDRGGSILTLPKKLVVEKGENNFDINFP